MVRYVKAFQDSDGNITSAIVKILQKENLNSGFFLISTITIIDAATLLSQCLYKYCVYSMNTVAPHVQYFFKFMKSITKCDEYCNCLVFLSGTIFRVYQSNPTKAPIIERFNELIEHLKKQKSFWTCYAIAREAMFHGCYHSVANKILESVREELETEIHYMWISSLSNLSKAEDNCIRYAQSDTGQLTLNTSIEKLNESAIQLMVISDYEIFLTDL